MIYRLFYVVMLVVFALHPFAARAEIRPIVFPVAGESSFRDDFREPRAGGAREHLGNDILAEKMTPLVSTVNGYVSYVVRPEASWGYSITIIDADGYQYRYLHMNNDTPGTDDGQGGEANAYAPGMHRGVQVQAGQLIGWVGDSGNAEETVPHLHFEIRNPSRNPINPYDSLVAAAPPGSVSSEITGATHESVGEEGVEEGSRYVFPAELKEGMTGFAVTELQIRLKEEGFFTLEPTKYFGPETTEALKKFQRAYGIAPTGVLNFSTRSLLNGDKLGDGTTLRLKEELFEGMEGEAVIQVQLKLKELEYFHRDATGIYDAFTRESVRRFQVENGASPTGTVNYETWNKLNDLYSEEVNLGGEFSGPFIFTQNMYIGLQTAQVRQLQTLLAGWGFFPDDVDTTGYYGPITEAAVKKYQIENNIEPVGVVGPITRAALNEDFLEPETAPKPSTAGAQTESYTFTLSLSTGSRGEEVRQLQLLLQEQGFFSTSVSATGYFGPITTAAVADFQTAHGINSIGIVGPKTRAALNSL